MRIKLKKFSGIIRINQGYWNSDMHLEDITPTDISNVMESIYVDCLNCGAERLAEMLFRVMSEGVGGNHVADEAKKLADLLYSQAERYAEENEEVAA